MIGFLLRRILLLTPTLFGITLVAFGFVRVLPGTRYCSWPASGA